ncbi:hypothetical protein GCM10028808_74720 [Spirosoma migulaei]
MEKAVDEIVNSLSNFLDFIISTLNKTTRQKAFLASYETQNRIELYSKLIYSSFLLAFSSWLNAVTNTASAFRINPNFKTINILNRFDEIQFSGLLPSMVVFVFLTIFCIEFPIKYSKYIEEESKKDIAFFLINYVYNFVSWINITLALMGITFFLIAVIVNILPYPIFVIFANIALIYVLYRSVLFAIIPYEFIKSYTKNTNLTFPITVSTIATFIYLILLGLFSNYITDKHSENNSLFFLNQKKYFQIDSVNANKFIISSKILFENNSENNYVIKPDNNLFYLYLKSRKTNIFSRDKIDTILFNAPNYEKVFVIKRNDPFLINLSATLDSVKIKTLINYKDHFHYHALLTFTTLDSQEVPIYDSPINALFFKYNNFYPLGF